MQKLENQKIRDQLSWKFIHVPQFVSICSGRRLTSNRGTSQSKRTHQRYMRLCFTPPDSVYTSQKGFTLVIWRYTNVVCCREWHKTCALERQEMLKCWHEPKATILNIVCNCAYARVCLCVWGRLVHTWRAPWKSRTSRYVSFFSAHHSMVFYFRCSVYWWKGSVRF